MGRLDSPAQLVMVVSCHMDSVYRDMENHSKDLAEGQVKVSLDAAIHFFKAEFEKDFSRSRSVRELIGRLDCWENPQVIVGGALKLILRRQIVGIAIYGISDNCSSHQIKPASANTLYSLLLSAPARSSRFRNLLWV